MASSRGRISVDSTSIRWTTPRWTRPTGVQPRLPAGLSPRVAEDAVAVVENQIGDELFVARILLGSGSWQKEIVGRVEQG